MRDYFNNILEAEEGKSKKRKISVPFHTPEVNLSEIPYPLIVISEA